MPKVCNTFGAQPGSIYRIKLENFVTYKQVELFPGSCLNMIIGPNGTGKSTFVCAIVLGLCGKIATIGRAKKISEYIRHGCQEAIIEIELYMQNNKNNVTITRQFNLKDTSRWYIDNKPVSQAAVITLISSLNIQVDNLCQLLPQDRVKDFAKMDPHTLLQSTLSAVGKENAVTELNKLKKWRTENRGLAEKLTKIKQRRQELTNQNDSLKIRIEAIKQKKELERQINACDCKLMWIEANNQKKLCQQYAADKKAVEKKLKVHREKMKPIEKSMESVNRAIQQLEQERLHLNTDITTLKVSASDQLQEVKFQNDQIKEAQSWYEEVEKKIESQKEELDEAKLLLQKFKSDKMKALQKYGDESKIKTEYHNLSKPITDLRHEITQIRTRIEEIQQEFENIIFPEMRHCQNKLQGLQSVERRRLETLENASSDAREALNWLRNNKDKFQGSVYGPMMLEINFAEQKYARYLENTVARRDLLAFTFSSPNDMNLFLRIVRKEMKLTQVNAVCSPPGQQLPQTPDVREISQYGFQTYLVDTFTAPDMIVHYLCKNYNVHKIPIGNDYTYNHSGQVPETIRLFFSEHHRFSVRVSVYSGHKSCSISEIKDPRLLADTVNVEQINKWQQQLAPLEKQALENRNEKQRVDKKLVEVKNKCHELENERNILKHHLEVMHNISSKIQSQERTIQDKENHEPIDINSEKEKCIKRQKECVIKQVKLHKDLVTEVLRPLHLKVASKQFATLKLHKNRDSILDKETKLREINKNLEQAQEELNKLTQLEERAKQKAKEKMVEAKRVSDNKEPNDPQFPFRGIYEELPNELSALQGHRAELNARTSCMGESDEGDLRTYNENLKLIEQLTTEEKSENKKNQQVEKSMTKLKVEWLKSLKELLSEISKRFSEMFANLGCAGEVRLKQGACEEDFAEYGVSVLVQFRANEELSELTQHTQSGGERALSTALYLLALQTLAAAPFRCVDEINQGMDSTNERKMYELMVKVTTQSQKGQYFLLTPKLLKQLTYNPKIMVHTIMNGSEIMKFNEWELDKFVERGHAFRG